MLGMKKVKPRTEKEIESEIKALELCKSYAPRCNVFGDNNHRNIDLQIEELEFGIDDSAEEWEGLSESEQSSILYARDWKEGEEDESPSSGWDNFKPKK